MSTAIHDALGRELYDAFRSCVPIDPITERHPELTIHDAYQIALAFVKHRLSDGETIIGKKIGVTSEAVQSMLDVDQPDFGYLTNVMQVPNEGSIPIEGRLISPRAEGEIAFILNAPLRGPGVTEADVVAATEKIVPCFEIVDSRIKDWKIKIVDTVADNASCGAFVLGDGEARLDDVDLVNLELVMAKNGAEIARGFGSAALGSPLRCVAWLANTLAEYGISLDPGDVILSGSLVPLEPVVAGDRVDLTLGNVGRASVTFT